jgi:hypothetical protein
MKYHVQWPSPVIDNTTTYTDELSCHVKDIRLTCRESSREMMALCWETETSWEGSPQARLSVADSSSVATYTAETLHRDAATQDLVLQVPQNQSNIIWGYGRQPHTEAKALAPQSSGVYSTEALGDDGHPDFCFPAGAFSRSLRFWVQIPDDCRNDGLGTSCFQRTNHAMLLPCA